MDARGYVWRRALVDIAGVLKSTIHTMPAVPTPHQQEVTEDPETETLEPVVWDEPVAKPFQGFTDGLPDILPGGMRAPSFFSNDFGN